MVLNVYRDLSAIRFIRCTSPIPETDIAAGGAGFTLNQAITKCESELAERTYEVQYLRPFGIIPIGIAAHMSFEKARQRALQEAVETHCLQQIRAEGIFRCNFSFRIGKRTFGIVKTNHGYFVLIRGFLNDTPIATYSADAAATSCLLKAWEEFRSIHFFNPKGQALKNFTKAHKLFDELALRNLLFNSKSGHSYNCPDRTYLERQTEFQERKIVYFTNGETR